MRPKLFFIGDRFLDCCLKYDFMRQLHHNVRLIVSCHLALSQPVLIFCVLWVTCDILQMHTRELEVSQEEAHLIRDTSVSQ